MLINKSFYFGNSSGQYSGQIEEPTTCPICKHALKPQELYCKDYKNEQGVWFVSSLYLCTHCYQSFLTLHKCTSLERNVNSAPRSFRVEFLYAEPMRYVEEHFDSGIEDLSPQFVKIYNQSLAAESSGLDEIAGLGYRKAVEFLVKDFCIHQNPDGEETIKELPLSQCITRYVNNAQIQTLATRAAWIGNDEAHYVRRQEGRDVSDMKNFIKAMVYFVGMILITEDAGSMSPA